MLPDRVILDTSSVLAGVLKPAGNPPLRPAAELVRWWVGSELRGVVSPALVAEYQEVIARPEHGLAVAEQQRVLEAARDPARTEQVQLRAPFPRRSRDPDDDHLLALALQSRADFLCTEDVAGLLDLHIIGDTVIVTSKVLFNKLRVDLEIDRAVRAGQ